MDAPLRKRLRRREVPGGVRFVTFSCQNRLPLFTNPTIAELFLAYLSTARARDGLQVYAWVVMPEHVHLLCRPATDHTLERVLRCMKVPIARIVIRRWRAMNASILARVCDANGRPRLWQKGGGFDRNVRNAAEFSREVRYIHRNPVERGLVDEPGAWRWSSVRWWRGSRDGEFECDPPPWGDWSHWKGFE